MTRCGDGSPTWGRQPEGHGLPTSNQKKRICFVICPIGPHKSRIRTRSDNLLKKVIQPVAEILGYETLRADDPAVGGDLPAAISRHMREDEIVIADMTDLNPNVLYELGRRHAFGGKIVHVAERDSSARLPFDVSHYKVHFYDLKNAPAIEGFRSELRRAIQGAQVERFPLSLEEVQRLSGATVLVQRASGKRSHYDLAVAFVNRRCRRIFLMQRSSTLILGPERGWGEEDQFSKALLKQIRAGAEFLHIVSLEGIRWHLEKKSSTFPDVDTSRSRAQADSRPRGNLGPEGPPLVLSPRPDIKG